MLGTTIQTCHVHFEMYGASEVATLEISRKIQNGARIITFALFGIFFVSTLGAPYISKWACYVCIVVQSTPRTH